MLNYVADFSKSVFSIRFIYEAKSVTPTFYVLLTQLTHYLTAVKIYISAMKIYRLENFRAKVLNK